MHTIDLLVRRLVRCKASALAAYEHWGDHVDWQSGLVPNVTEAMFPLILTKFLQLLDVLLLNGSVPVIVFDGAVLPEQLQKAAVREERQRYGGSHSLLADAGIDEIFAVSLQSTTKERVTGDRRK